jgi:hypothetical protein
VAKLAGLLVGRIEVKSARSDRRIRQQASDEVTCATIRVQDVAVLMVERREPTHDRPRVRTGKPDKVTATANEEERATDAFVWDNCVRVIAGMWIVELLRVWHRLSSQRPGRDRAVRISAESDAARNRSHDRADEARIMNSEQLRRLAPARNADDDNATGIDFRLVA